MRGWVPWLKSSVATTGLEKGALKVLVALACGWISSVVTRTKPELEQQEERAKWALRTATWTPKSACLNQGGTWLHGKKTARSGLLLEYELCLLAVTPWRIPSKR